MNLKKINQAQTGDFPCQIITDNGSEGSTVFKKTHFPSEVGTNFYIISEHFAKYVGHEEYHHPCIEKSTNNDGDVFFAFTFTKAHGGFWNEIKVKKINIRKHAEEDYETMRSNAEQDFKVAESCRKLFPVWDLENAIIDGWEKLEDSVKENWEELSRMEWVDKNQLALDFHNEAKKLSEEGKEALKASGYTIVLDELNDLERKLENKLKRVFDEDAVVVKTQNPSTT